MEKENITFESLMYKDFAVHEGADRLEETISKCDSLVDALASSVEYMLEQGTTPTDERQILMALKAINDYSVKAKERVRVLVKDCISLHDALVTGYQRIIGTVS